MSKLLLLGAGESGKSTLFKQLTNIYGEGFSESDRRSFVPIVANNVISAMQTLCRQSDRLADSAAQLDAERSEKLVENHVVQNVDGAQFRVRDATNQKFKRRVLRLHPLDDELTEDICYMLTSLWSDNGIRATYAHRGSFLLADSAAYFFGRLNEVKMWRSDYDPSLSDIVRCRVRTTGIIEQHYTYKGAKFHIFDVGGQRNERKKWIYLFENVTAVLFVAALSSYDQPLYEDSAVNRMHESLRLFEEICGLQWFQKASVILFLNKLDLFAEKINAIPLSVCFPDFKFNTAGSTSIGKESASTTRRAATAVSSNDSASSSGDGLDRSGTSAEDAIAYIRQQFVERVKDAEKKVYCHVTTAVDINNVTVVFNTCQDIILDKILAKSGLLMG